MDWRAQSLAASGGCWGAAAGAVAKLAASRPSGAQQILLYGVHVSVRPLPLFHVFAGARSQTKVRRILKEVAAHPEGLHPDIAKP